MNFFPKRSQQIFIEYKHSIRLTVCSCHVTYLFQSESTIYNCMNVKELLAQNRPKIRSLSDCNGTRESSAKWLNVRLRTKWLWVLVPLQSLIRFDNVWILLYIKFIDFMLKGKSLLVYTNLFSPNEYEKNDNKIILKCFQ